MVNVVTILGSVVVWGDGGGRGVRRMFAKQRFRNGNAVQFYFAGEVSGVSWSSVFVVSANALDNK